MSPAASQPVPRFRGVAHAWAFVATVSLGAGLLAASPSAGKRAAVAIYVVGMAAMFGVSALYHRGPWGPTVRSVLRRCDHSAIYLAIAGTYTPVALFALSGWGRVTVLAIVWGGSAAGIAMAWLRRDLAGVVGGALFVIVGWGALVVLPQLWTSLGPLGFALILGGGVCYTLGAVVLFARRPDPWPASFGYHEVWHAFTVVAASLHMVAIRFAVLPAA